jgi:hypothetical protein
MYFDFPIFNKIINKGGAHGGTLWYTEIEEV